MSRIYDALQRSESLRGAVGSLEPVPLHHPPRFEGPLPDLPGEPVEELFERLCSLEVAVYALEDRLSLDLPALKQAIQGGADRSSRAVADRDDAASERLARRFDETASRLDHALSRTQRRITVAVLTTAVFLVAFALAHW